MFYRLPRWSWSLQTIETEDMDIHFNLGLEVKTTNVYCYQSYFNCLYFSILIEMEIH